MEFRVGVIGATGFIGGAYRKEMRETGKATMVALCARRRDALEAAAREDGCDFITDDWRQVAEHPDVNLILVTTPDALHHEAVMASVRQGKHIVCDKPIGANATEAHEMWAAIRDAKLAHFVPFWTRYEAPFIRAKEIMDSGKLGEIKGILYRWQNPRPAAMPFTWRDDATLSSAGSIADVGSHSYDTVRWIVGCEARRVLAHADTITPAKPDLGTVYLDKALDWANSHTATDVAERRKGTAFDYATIAWEFENGAVGAITLSHAPFLRKGLAPELELHGTQASLGVDRITNTVSLVYPGQDTAEVEHVEKSGPVNRFARYVFPALHQRLSGSPCEHPGMEDGWRVQIFTDAAALSARRGTWVELAELAGD